MKTHRPNILSQRQAGSQIEADFNDFFTDNMIFQRDKAIHVNGFGQPGVRLRISFDGETRKTRVQRDGLWQLRFNKRPASANPMELSLELKTEGKEYKKLKTLTNIVCGDIWLCSGQSNIEMGLALCEGGKEAAENARDPLLRLMLIEKASSPIPLRSVPHEWKESSKEKVLEHGWEGFSAAAWWFGVALRRELGIPIGLIQAAFGGAKIHPFLQSTSPLKGISRACRRELAAYVQEAQSADQRWAAQIGRDKRESLSEEEAASLHPNVSFNEYNTMKIGHSWNAMLAPLGNFPIKGVLWYQGESDADSPSVYGDKLKLLSRQFSRSFSSKHLIFAQLAPWTYGSAQTLPLFWETQAAFAQKSGFPMAGTADIGDLSDIHPAKKQPLGERFAALALRDCYGRKDNGAGSPVWHRVSRGEESLAIEFRAMNKKPLGGLEARGNNGFPTGFEAQWKDGRREEISGRVDGNGVLLDCPNAKDIRLIEYAFKQEAGGNLFNTRGEPAIPFRIKF